MTVRSQAQSVRSTWPEEMEDHQAYEEHKDRNDAHIGGIVRDGTGMWPGIPLSKASKAQRGSTD